MHFKFSKLLADIWKEIVKRKDNSVPELQLREYNTEYWFNNNYVANKCSYKGMVRWLMILFIGPTTKDIGYNRWESAQSEPSLECI